MKFLSFGECLLRIATKAEETFGPTDNAKLYFGGSELNVSIALSALGVSADWISLLPKSELGEVIHELIKKEGLPLSHTNLASGNMACYFLESGSGERPAKVIDRIAGPLKSSERKLFNWKDILKDFTHFHTTGISSGLSDTCLLDVTEALVRSKELGLTTSYDFNYRGKLWSLESAKEKQKPLMDQIDILFGGLSDLETMLDIEVSENRSIESYQKEIFDRYKFKQVVISERRDGYYKVTGYEVDNFASSPWKSLSGVDRIGTGDAMAAGFLYAKSLGKNLSESVETAANLGALKDSFKGDFINISESQYNRWTNPQGHWR